jgi:F-type H+-transporting ATPase subunit c
MVLVAFAFVALVPEVALAAEEGSGSWWGIAVGAGLAIGLGALGCGIGQGLATSGAVQGIARNPGAAGQIQTPMIIGLALIESISLYAFVIGFLLQGKVG